MSFVKDWLIIKLKGFDKMSTLSLKIVPGILAGPKVFQLCTMSFRISSDAVGLSTDKFSERVLRKLVFFRTRNIFR